MKIETIKEKFKQEETLTEERREVTPDIVKAIHDKGKDDYEKEKK